MESKLKVASDCLIYEKVYEDGSAYLYFPSDGSLEEFEIIKKNMYLRQAKKLAYHEGIWSRTVQLLYKNEKIKLMYDDMYGNMFIVDAKDIDFARDIIISMLEF